MTSISTRYRPQRFADVTAQESTKETLRLEVATGMLAHAFLFSGPRGIGKTTIARIFAKALNCLAPVDGEPCNQCDACLDVDRGSSLDVIEMDAASNTGVDNIRESIIEHVRFQPQRKRKIYILDEAHMLSTAAWNALLKTVEEPPAYAFFLFLTTEVHKVPATIQSRCQRFDFKRIPDEALVNRLNDLAKREEVTVDDDVLKRIVSLADGCLRDAESLFSQLLVLGEKHLTAEIAGVVMPMSRLPIAAQLLASWSTRQLGASLAILNELEEQGLSFLALFDDLISAVRSLLIAADATSWKEKLANGDVGEQTLSKLVGVFEPAELSRMALMLMERRRDAKQGIDAKFCLELATSAVTLRLLDATVSTNVQIPNPKSQINPNIQEPNHQNLQATTSVRHPEPNRLTGEGSRDLKVREVIPPEPVYQEIPPDPPIEISPAPVKPPTEVSSSGTLTLAKVQSIWPTFIHKVDEKSPSLTFILKTSRAHHVEGDRLIIEFQYAFHRTKIIDNIKTKQLVETVLREVTSTPTALIDGIIGTTSSTEENGSQDMVNNILKTFGGQIVDASGPTTA